MLCMGLVIQVVASLPGLELCLLQRRIRLEYSVTQMPTGYTCLGDGYSQAATLSVLVLVC